MSWCIENRGFYIMESCFRRKLKRDTILLNYRLPGRLGGDFMLENLFKKRTDLDKLSSSNIDEVDKIEIEE